MKSKKLKPICKVFYLTNKYLKMRLQYTKIEKESNNIKNEMKSNLSLFHKILVLGILK